MTTQATNFRGCGTALVTPMTPAGSVDHDALRRLVEWQVGEGIDYLVPCGTTGEAQTLTPDERRAVVQTTLSAAAGRAPVVAGASDNSTSRAVEEVRAMCGLGVDGILSATPYYNKPTPDGQLRHYEAIAEASTAPIMLYNVPGRTACNMLPATVLRLAQHPRVAAVKEASGDIPQVLELIAGKPDGFEVLAGEDSLVLPIVACGGVGVVSVVANECPRAMTAMVHASLAADLETARRLFFGLLPLMEANFFETSPGPVKAALALRGRIENVLRLPLVPITDATAERLRPALELAEQVSAEQLQGA